MPVREQSSNTVSHQIESQKVVVSAALVNVSVPAMLPVQTSTCTEGCYTLLKDFYLILGGYFCAS
jgi:hypothetical protein